MPSAGREQTGPAWGTFLELEPPAEGPLHARLTRALRTAVTSGRLAAGSTLPASRVLAADLRCSRWVVTEAYAQLVAEGYFEARSGSATRVRARTGGSVRGGAREDGDRWTPRYDLLPGVPDLRAFPRKRWADMVRAATTELTWDELGYPDAAGLPRLRRQLAAYLARGRGARLEPGQLVVCAGTLDAVMRLCRSLRAAGHTHVAVEDPGWTQLRLTVAAAGLTPVPIPVDGHGLRVDLLREAGGVRAVIVAPAHQFPTGVVLAPTRRAELADWAREMDGLVMEDDYDAEFRYDRHPVGALQGVAPEHVALLGSLSKTLSPAVRLGWIAAPERWTDALTARDTGGTPPPVIDQDAFTRFVSSGSYDRHLRASRLRYKRRRDHLLRELEARLPGQPVGGAAAGFHLLLPLADCPAGALVEEAARADVRLASLDDYRAAPAATDTPTASTLVVGYGNLTDQAVPGAVQRLAHAIERVRAQSTARRGVGT
ncbi:PLP-dependent aminotransferase family protein [Streptomyces cyaneofuscatus]|uniref:PLP-dependent aminotransferase family protein n=1 Tax=Streptomyces cyaneofuscatus TaxID=66883 RepID=A0ABZ1EVP3_9ACTN|nr:PLP-dependent aminotransferase family protein [Streptomyces cyaneofuscatus]WSB08163.1 PLP-dependent aminotransferase family protein [Streptomyces cyaneofuscatus]WSD48304.1 PLP-dependent aminotransferase family protein [Streptomyces cyaneofuscatus]